jgi:hypothetical protein
LVTTDGTQENCRGIWIRPSATHSESIPTTAAVEAEITYFDLDPGDFEEAIGQITVAVSSNRTWAET